MPGRAARPASAVSPALASAGVDVGVEREGRDVYLSARSSDGRGARVVLRMPRASMHALLAVLFLVSDRDEAPDHYELRLRGSLDARI